MTDEAYFSEKDPCDKCNGTKKYSYMGHDIECFKCDGTGKKLLDCEGTDNIICPYCGHDHDDSDFEGGSSTTWNCSECEKEFRIDPSYSVDYSTYRLDCVNGLAEHEYVEVVSTHPQGRRCKICDKKEH